MALGCSGKLNAAGTKVYYMSVLIIIIPLIFIAAVPSLAIIYLVNVWLNRPKIPAKTFAIISMFLAFATAINLKLELENGLVTLPFQLAILSSLWVVFFILAFLAYKLLRKNT